MLTTTDYCRFIKKSPFSSQTLVISVDSLSLSFIKLDQYIFLCCPLNFDMSLFWSNSTFIIDHVFLPSALDQIVSEVC